MPAAKFSQGTSTLPRPDHDKLGITLQAYQELSEVLGSDWLETHTRRYTSVDPHQTTILSTATAACVETGSILVELLTLNPP